MYNPDDVFKTKNTEVKNELNDTNDELAVIEYKESFLNRVISKIKRFLNIR